MPAVSAADLVLQEKNVTGSYMGSNRFRKDMPRYVELYLQALRSRIQGRALERIRLASPLGAQECDPGRQKLGLIRQRLRRNLDQVVQHRARGR